jgi:hypothetical protein
MIWYKGGEKKKIWREEGEEEIVKRGEEKGG